jgi:hypothetical protein
MLNGKSPIQNSIGKADKKNDPVGSTLIITVLCGKKATYFYFIILTKRHEFQLPRKVL